MVFATCQAVVDYCHDSEVVKRSKMIDLGFDRQNKSTMVLNFDWFRAWQVIFYFRRERPPTAYCISPPYVRWALIQYLYIPILLSVTMI